LAQLNPGSDEAPETSATLVLQLAALGSGTTLQLSGPGLAAPTTMQVDGLPPGFVGEWATNHARFPRGIDLILCAGDRLAAFPRTLTIKEA
jgi:alpha-D-ribose 1-methylphosphonate 5-triphosphate synthase subunit PhnH